MYLRKHSIIEKVFLTLRNHALSKSKTNLAALCTKIIDFVLEIIRNT